MLPIVKAKLLEGKKGLIVGIANENSIAWGCAKAFRAFGAEVAVTYVNDKARKYVEPLAREVEAPIVHATRCSIRRGRWRRSLNGSSKEWGKLDFVVHSIAFSPKEALHGRVVDVSREGFRDHHGCFLLDLHSHGTSGGAPDAQGRHAVHDVVLRQPDGR